jgi:NodT family efflux transporter outer membrane factor (OMF) lipoprotein
MHRRETPRGFIQLRRWRVTDPWRYWPFEVLAAAYFSATLSSCAVGPDFAPPPAPAVERFTPEKTGSPGGGQRFHEGADIPAQWWKAFGSERLDALIDAALAQNPTLEAADAAIRVAQFNSDAAVGGFFPQVGLASSSNYIYSSGDSTTTTVTQTGYSFFTKQVNVSFAPDVWGANRRLVESLDAQTEAARYQHQAAALTLVANVAKAAIEEASLRAQIAVTRKLVDVQQERLTLLQRQLAVGAISGTDILSQETALAQTRQTLPPLETRLAQQRNLLAALAGRYPSDEIAETFELSGLSLPRDLPLSLPSQVVAQRPDIKAAEAQVHAASAKVGVALAARLPNIVLTGNGGSGAFQVAQLFAPGTMYYNLAGGVAQPLFDGMTLLNKHRAAEAGFDQAEAQYRSAVVNAFQNVADVLRALQGNARAVRDARAAEAAARQYLGKVKSQLTAGAVSQLAVVDAQRAWLATTISRFQTEAQRLTNAVALYVALGGGIG